MTRPTDDFDPWAALFTWAVWGWMAIASAAMIAGALGWVLGVDWGV